MKALQTCGAKTRKGHPCPSRPVKNRRRCRMHGGASLQGEAHPRFKHGLYSRFSFVGMAERAAAREEVRHRARLRTFEREARKRGVSSEREAVALFLEIVRRGPKM